MLTLTYMGIAGTDQAIYIPATDFVHVAEVVQRLAASGKPLEELTIAVRAGEMELGDAGGTYGSHVWQR